MKRAIVIPATLALLAAIAAPANAQTVQRCESADGKVSYVNGPCPSGATAVRSLPAADAPSAADQKAARERARKDAQQVGAVERSRKAEEARVAREQEKAQAKANKQEAHCRRLATRVRHAKEDFAAAALNKQKEAQRRVKRAEALYAEDCGPTG